MKLALIASPWVFDNQVEFRSQQLGLGYVGAYAERCGHRVVAFIDPMVEGGHQIRKPLHTRYRLTYRFGHSDSSIVERIPSDTDLIGLNAPFTDSRLTAYPLINAIKAAFPDMPIVVGGVLGTTLPRQVMEESKADVVVRGEGEIAFARIANGEPLELIPGLVYRGRNGEILENPGRCEQLADVDALPEPGYHFRPMEDYISWSPRGDRSRRTLSMVSSRGCPFSCEFCSIPEKGQTWRPFSAERVLREIDMAIERFGVNHIEFEDDNFTFHEKRAIAILGHIAELRARGIDLSCSFPNGVMIDRMTSDLATLMAKAGTDIAYLPVESGDPRILACMDKPKADEHLEKTLQVASHCADAGLPVSCFFIVAYPGGLIRRKSYLRPEYERHCVIEGEQVYMRGEDEESFEKTLRFCHRLRDAGVLGITPLIATPYPGTQLYEVCDKFGWLAFEDAKDVLTTVSYAHMKPEYVQIDTPYCSRTRAYERWKEMMERFPAFHNVRRFGEEEDLVPTQNVAVRERSLANDSASSDGAQPTGNRSSS